MKSKDNLGRGFSDRARLGRDDDRPIVNDTVVARPIGR